MTKNNILQLIILVLIFSCSGNSSSKESIKSAADINPIENSDSIIFEEYISIYKYDSTFSDSSLVYEQWISKDSAVKKSGEFYYPLPIQSEFIDRQIIESAKGKKPYKTFDQTVCEVGGRSAWNKFVFLYDSKKRPIAVKHYKAWLDAYDKYGNPYTNKKPDYFLGEEIYFQYIDNTTTQITKDETGKLIERITKCVDNQSRLIFEEWIAWDEHRYRIYYKYDQ